MGKTLQKIITLSFLLLFFFVPLIFLPFPNFHTSELFEFNKIVLTYILTAIIVGMWLARMVVGRRITFRRTILDIPILIFLLSQILSTITSIDLRTSLFGFYSRFNGGLASLLSYSLLYWAWVSNMDKEKTLLAIKVLLSSALLVCVYGVLQHFGIDKNIWVQDVQNRVFSTLGQPNWLAAWLVALSPITWTYFVKNKEKLNWGALSLLFLLVVLYTKSRSGLLAFGFAFVLFWAIELWIAKTTKKGVSNIKKLFGISLLSFSILLLLAGTPWTKPIFSQQVESQQEFSEQGPALETGGTESGEIRKIVWKGAFDIWKNYPLLGTGVETFGISYYFFRPVEHNLVSEWDFLYNKAHNEYLNTLATTGILGLGAYLYLTVSIILFLFREKRVGLLAGYSSILVTNFFGFSVVPVTTLFFLYPAFASTLAVNELTKKDNQKTFEGLGTSQKTLFLLVIVATSYIIFAILRYWYADFVYAKGKILKDSGNPVAARELLIKSTNLSPSEALYWNELSQADSDIAVALAEEDEIDDATKFAMMAVEENDKAISLSPKNVNLYRNRANMFIKLSTLDNNYLLFAKEALGSATSMAPTEAKLFYNLGLTQARIGNTSEAIEILTKTVEMKKNYRNARFALAILLAEEGQRQEAVLQLEYILANIDPEDTLVKQQLEEYR